MDRRSLEHKLSNVTKLLPSNLIRDWKILLQYYILTLSMKRNTALAIFALIAVPVLITATYVATVKVPQVSALSHADTPSPNQKAIAHACFIQLGRSHPPPFCK